MGRIVKQIEIEGQPATALFDTGANYTYVRADLGSKRTAKALRHLLLPLLWADRKLRLREVCLG
jgi:hypothetical protein